MSFQSFKDYLNSTFSAKKSGTAHSYFTAIKILDEIFRQNDVFNLKDKSLLELSDPLLISRIIDFVADEEDKFRKNEDSIFDLGKANQTSYPKKRFCTAAIRKLGEFIAKKCESDAIQLMNASNKDGIKLSLDLQRNYHINDLGSDKECIAKRRIGQDIFRALLLEIYESKCCLTGIDIPEVLRASHIIPWSERTDSRLNPENGLCLSATYDAAFDKHLITFDEDFRMLLSPMLKELYTSEAFKKYFLEFEGKRINLPTRYKPSQIFLDTHRNKLIV